jgi:CO dehydrogenase/acetyl-CoA synthase gamma subunit (corrinoid Fe-S protein)
MVFATRIAEGAKGPEDCPHLEEEKKMKLEEYMDPFQFDV